MAANLTTAPPAYNINPQSQGGTGTFGQVPGNIDLPNVSGDLASQIPGLGKLNTAASSDIASNLAGTLSPGTENALQNAAATYGETSGMPGSDLTWNSLYGNIAGASTAEQAQGLSEYNSLIPTVSGTQTLSPDLMTQVAEQNAVNTASPNPVDAGVLSTVLNAAGSY